MSLQEDFEDLLQKLQDKDDNDERIRMADILKLFEIQRKIHVEQDDHYNNVSAELQDLRDTKEDKDYDYAW